MKLPIAAFLFLLTSSSTYLCGQLPAEIDLRNPAEVQKEVKRIQKQYPGDPLRAAEEVRRLTERMAEANGISDKHRKMIARDEAFRKKYGVPSNSSMIPGVHDEPGKTIDFSAWQWKLERQKDRWVLVFNLDNVRYKTAAGALPAVVLRRKGKSAMDEEDFQHGGRHLDNIHVNLAFSSLGNNAFRTEFWIPDSEIETYVIQVSLVLEPEWEACGIIPLKRK